MIAKIIKIINLLPYDIVCFPYFIAVKTIQEIFNSDSLQVWPRNSYIFKNIVSGLSDLDFTFYYEQKVTNSRIDRDLQLYRLLKYLFPFLGEVNVYHQELNWMTIQTINALELQRDLTLLTKVGQKDVLDSDIIIFLLRSLESDYLNLKNRGHLRKNKWQSHFKSCGIAYDVDKLNFEYIKNQIDYFISTKTNPAIAEVFHKYFSDQYFVIEANYHKKEKILEFMCLFPIPWLGPSFSNKNQERDCLMLLDSKPYYFSLFLSHLHWEIWGIMTQLRSDIIERSWLQHINKIREVLILLSKRGDERCLNLLKMIDQLHK